MKNLFILDDSLDELPEEKINEIASFIYGTVHETEDIQVVSLSPLMDRHFLKDAISKDFDDYVAVIFEDCYHLMTRETLSEFSEALAYLKYVGCTSWQVACDFLGAA